MSPAVDPGEKLPGCAVLIVPAIGLLVALVLVIWWTCALVAVLGS